MVKVDCVRAKGSKCKGWKCLDGHLYRKNSWKCSPRIFAKLWSLLFWGEGPQGHRIKLHKEPNK